MKRLIIALLLLGVQPALAADPWTSVRSKNFLLIGDASEEKIREIATNLERFREAVSLIMPGAAEPSVGTTVVVFRNDSSFEPFKPLYQGKPASVGGYFQPGDDVNFIAMRADQDTPRLIYHEYVHLLTMDSVSYAPAWFREGIAEYYSTFRLAGGGQRARVGQTINEHMLELRQRPFGPLSTLMSVDRDSPEYNEIERQGSFYAQSWAMVHYLRHGDSGRHEPQISAFLKMLTDGRSAEDSFEGAFQIDPAALQRSMDQYIRNQNGWASVEFTFENPVIVNSEVQVRPLSEAEVQAHLGDLLLHCDRLQEAETYLQKALQLDAGIGTVHASLGMLRLRQQNYPEALNYLKRAAELDTGNHLVHYYYADLLEKQSAQTQLEPTEEQFEAMQAELRKAIQLKPGYVPALEKLAYVNLLQYQNIGESISLLREALRLSPGRERLMIFLAQLLVDDGDQEGARAILQPLAMNTSSDVAIRQRAQRLLDYMESPASALGFAEILPDAEPLEDVQPAPAPAPRDVPSDTPTVIERVDAVPQTVQGEALDGLLTHMDCANGVTMTVNTAGQSVKLHTATPQNIQFVSYTASVSTSIACGPTPGTGIPVRITYRPDASNGTIGEPLVVAFTERN